MKCLKRFVSYQDKIHQVWNGVRGKKLPRNPDHPEIMY